MTRTDCEALGPVPLERRRRQSGGRQEVSDDSLLSGKSNLDETNITSVPDGFNQSPKPGVSQVTPLESPVNITS